MLVEDAPSATLHSFQLQKMWRKKVEAPPASEAGSLPTTPSKGKQASGSVDRCQSIAVAHP